nr:MAG TPA: Magnesium transport protein CorA protein, ion channel, magnesium [Caudoviricetes sp.]
MCNLLSLIDIERIMSNSNLHLIAAPLFLALIWSWTKSLGRTMDIVITVFSLWFIPITILITELYLNHKDVSEINLVIVYPGYWVYLVIATIVVIPAVLVFKTKG